MVSLGGQTPSGQKTATGLDVDSLKRVADSLAEELRRSPVFYVLTNSRALTEEGAIALAREIVVRQGDDP